MIVLRSLVFNIFFIAVSTGMALFGLCLVPLGEARVLAVARAWALVQLWGARHLCGITWRVTGRENLGESPLLIASIHQSAFDTMVWFAITRRPSYVVKRELTRVPVFGWLLGRSGMIVVDRKAGAAAVRALQQGARAAAADGRDIVIFPQGTRADPDAPIRLHPGIAGISRQTGLPVTPVATNSGRHWARRAFLKHPGVVELAILPPIPAELGRAALLARLQADLEAGYAAIDPAGRVAASCAA